MRSIKTLFGTLLLSVAGTLAIEAQNKPVFHNFEFEDQGVIRNMSDNGKWAVSSSNNESTCVTHLIDLEKNTSVTLSSNDKTEYGIDVTDDGSTIVGHVANVPAIYSSFVECWMPLETTSDHKKGFATGVTPDGKYAVGELTGSNEFDIIAALWELNEEGGTLVSTPGLPKKDMSQKDQGMMQFKAISADARYILGVMSYSYMPAGNDAGGCFFYVYDRTNKSYKPIGFKETQVGNWTPLADGLTFISDAVMSNNGRYVSGQAHIARLVEGEEYADEYDVPFLYDVEKDKFTCYDETMIQNTACFAVSNDGVVTTCSPVGSPVREWAVRSGKYWFSFAEILKQKYNTSINTYISSSNTGTINCIADDCKRIVAFPDPYSSYVVDLPEVIGSVSNGIKLLGSYSVSPENGSYISKLKNVTVTFDRNITAVGSTNSAQILDENDNVVYNSVGFSAEGKVLTISFRKGALDADKNYKLFIPEGTIALEDDATQTNSDIYVSYTGREDVPVKVNEIYPANNAVFSYIDYSTSPVMIAFDTYINITDSATAYLYRNEEEQPFCSLTLAQSENKLALYPTTLQYLYDGSTYRIKISKGAVTDVAGNNPCEAITINYTGNYVRTISADDVILFSDNFDSGTGNFMMWCGDNLTPNEEMTNWDFSKGLAWGLVRDDETSGNLATVSHSMYSTAGQSDDWLVIPQIYIPDMLCSMNFLSQSYKADKKDVLKVIVWESNNVYNTLDADIIAKMKAEGKVVYDKVQSIGTTEGQLTGEYTKNNISLAEFAEKSVYIAFVNQNNDQSAIFIDSVEVRHDMTYLVTLNYEESVVNKSDVTISGVIIGNSDKAYDKVTMTLVDSEGKTVDTYTASGLNLKKNAQHKFAFTKTLPLTVGKENKFSVSVSLDGDNNSIKGSIKDLAFQPVKRIVLEEYTGRACGNCPLGIVGMEKLEARYGESFIPISIHTYNNDPLGSGLTNYSSYLGLDQLGAPSGMINRGTGCYPAVSATVNDKIRYFYTNQDPELPNEEDKLWMDYANDEMAIPAECDINIRAVYDEASMSFIVPCEIKYALNAKNLNVNLLTVLVEDNVSQAQQNFMASYDTQDIGEWALGGKYGQSVVTDYLHKDVCRNVNGFTLNGTGGLVPATVEAGVTYKAQVSIPVPASVGSLTSCKVIVIMINANTGKVVNAARAKYTGETSETAVEEVESETIIDNAIFTITGQRISSPKKGINIINGKKVYLH